VQQARGHEVLALRAESIRSILRKYRREGWGPYHMFKHPLFWVLCVIAGMFIIAGAIREPSQHHKPEYTAEPSKHYEEAAQPKCAPPRSDWLQQRLSNLRKQTTEAENAVTEFRARNDIIGASGMTVVDQETDELTKARSKPGDAPATEKQILETRIKHLEWTLETVVSELRRLHELESVAQSYRALYDGLMRRHAAEINCAP
jgi:hypothetical protein